MQHDAVVDAVDQTFLIRCGRPSVEQMIRTDLEAQGFRYDLDAATLLLIDAPSGFVLRQLEAPDQRNRKTIVVTPNTIPEYWLDILNFKPTVLIVGNTLNREVEQAIVNVAAGQTYVSTPPNTSPLMPCERHVLRYVARGWSNKQIAQHLNKGEQTVANSLCRIYNALGISGRVEAAFYYYGLPELIW